MTPVDALAILGAGVAAGAINAVVGSGSLITFPTLLAVGYPAVVANVTNNVGLVPGSFSGAIGYRAELVGQRSRLIVLGAASLAGGLTGAILLLALPGSVFERVIPGLILLACLLVAVQPQLSRLLTERRGARSRVGADLWATVYLTGVYGGYFGAAQGVILIALLAIFIADDWQRLNGAKNVLVLLVNGIAAVLFIAFSHVAWGAAGLVALGAIVGGQVGAKLGRRLQPNLLRAVIIAVGITASVVLLA